MLKVIQNNNQAVKLFFIRLIFILPLMFIPKFNLIDLPACNFKNR